MSIRFPSVISSRKGYFPNAGLFQCEDSELSLSFYLSYTKNIIEEAK